MYAKKLSNSCWPQDWIIGIPQIQNPGRYIDQMIAETLLLRPHYTQWFNIVLHVIPVAVLSDECPDINPYGRNPGGGGFGPPAC